MKSGLWRAVFAAAALTVSVAGCSAGADSKGNAQAVDDEPVHRTPAQECARTVTAAVGAHVFIGIGKGSSKELQERHAYENKFAASYLGTPEMEIFLRANSDATIAHNNGSTYTEAVAAGAQVAEEKCAEQYP
jgi:hypothetical protein